MIDPRRVVERETERVFSIIIKRGVLNDDEAERKKRAI
jgi:hypothetical protein